MRKLYYLPSSIVASLTKLQTSVDSVMESSKAAYKNGEITIHEMMACTFDCVQASKKIDSLKKIFGAMVLKFEADSEKKYRSMKTQLSAKYGLSVTGATITFEDTKKLRESLATSKYHCALSDEASEELKAIFHSGETHAAVYADTDSVKEKKEVAEATNE